MNSAKVRWGILGAGKIAQSFVKDFASVTQAELIAVASADKERGATFAANNGIPNALSYEELYSNTAIDAVYIATTHNFHFEQCRHCLLHGKHVLCEKPITLNDVQFKELSRLSKQNNVFLMEAMWTWFLPAVLKAKAWIEQGKIGTLKVIEATFGFPAPVNPEGRMYNIELAGGALLDIGVYPVAIATFFNNTPPVSITASGILTTTRVDERTGIILQYDKVSAFLSTSMVNLMANKAILYGDKGYIEIPWFYKAKEATLYDNEQKPVEHFADDRLTIGYNFEIQHATDCILQGNNESNVVSHYHSNIVQEIMTEVRRQIGVVYPGEKD